jgi:hypothetical protein
VRSAAEQSETTPQGRAALLAAPVGVAAASALSLGVLALIQRSPVGLPGCPFHVLTGMWCPLCGGTRAVSALVSGDVVGALGLNAVVVLAVPLLLLEWGRWTVGRARRRPTAFLDVSGRTIAVVAAVLLVFAVVRNMPGADALAP